MNKNYFIFALTFLGIFGGFGSLFAEELTENKTVTAVGGTAYNSSVEGVVLTFSTGGGTQTGALTGTLGIVFDITGSNQNGNRVTLSGTNTFTGGLTVKNGTLLSSAATALGAANSSITLNTGTLMINGANASITQSIVLDGYGALRASAAFTQTGKITGTGDLLVHCESGNVLTISNTANDYTGLTNIGGYNVPGSGNTVAKVNLGNSEVLPDGTTLQIGVTYGTPNTNTKLAESYLDMKGFSETVAGLEGVGILKNTATGASTMNIVTGTGATHTFSGTVTGTGVLTAAISGDGTQILSGTLTNVGLAVSGNATLNIGTRTSDVTLATLSVTENGTLASDTAGTTLSVGGNIVLGGTLTNIGTINETGTGSITFSGTNDYSGLTVNVNSGTVVLNPTGDAVNGATVNYTADSTLDLNGVSPTFSTLPTVNITNSNTTTLSTLTFGNDVADDAYNNTISLPSGSAGIALIKTGTNTVTLGGSISATSLSVNSGAVVLGSASNLTFKGAVTGASASSLVFSAGASLTAASLTITGASSIDLNGANLTLSTAPTTAITNSNSNALSIFTYTGNGGNATMPVISGNTRFVLNMGTNANNQNRVYLSNGSKFAGGIEIQQGTLRMDSLDSLALPTTEIDGKTYRQLDFNGGSWMVNNRTISDTYVLDLKENGGALRGTGGTVTMNALITGVGALEIVNDSDVVIGNQKNDYQGWTYLGKTAFRSDGLAVGGKMLLGNNEVLPDTTVVQIGGGAVTGSLTFDLASYTETVAGLTGGTSSGANNGILTSSAGGTLIVNDAANYTYTGRITGNANIRKTGSAVWSLTGTVSTTGTISAENGTINYSGTSTIANLTATGDTNAGTAGTVNLNGAGGAASVLVENGGKVNLNAGTITTANANGGGTLNILSGTVSTLNLNGGTASFQVGADLSGTVINGLTGNSTIKLNPLRTYLQQMFESPTKAVVDSYYQYTGDLTAAANEITNMDQWVNKTGALAAATWGDTSTDKSVTNIFQMLVTNTTADDIVLDFGKSFRNDVQITIADGDTIIGTLNWTNTTGTAAYSTGTLEGVTLESGKECTITVRASRFNRTIGCGWNDGTGNFYYGLNGQSDYTGVGVRVNGTDTWYALNILSSGEWAIEGSGLYTGGSSIGTFAPQTLNVADGATVTLAVEGNSAIVVATPATGTGTLAFQNTGVLPSHIVLGENAEGSISIGSNIVMNTGTGTRTIGGDLIFAKDSVYTINDSTTRLIVNNISGSGLISIDLDEIIAGTADALITLLETDPEVIDVTDLSLEFTTEQSWEAFLNKVYTVFESDGLNPEKVGTMLKNGANDVWNIWQNPNTGMIYMALNQNAIPEPSTWCLMLFGLMGLFAMRRRNLRRA